MMGKTVSGVDLCIRSDQPVRCRSSSGKSSSNTRQACDSISILSSVAVPKLWSVRRSHQLERYQGARHTASVICTQQPQIMRRGTFCRLYVRSVFMYTYVNLAQVMALRPESTGASATTTSATTLRSSCLLNAMLSTRHAWQSTTISSADNVPCMLYKRLHVA